MINKYKKEIIIFLIGFLFYYILGIILSYYLDTSNYWNVLFDLDTPRVLGDLSVRYFDHYRTAVHPLFVIIFQPIVYILKSILNSPILAILLIQSIISASSLLLFYSILKKIKIPNTNKMFFVVLFAFSFGQVVFSAAIETYIYAQFFLMLLWFFVVSKLDKNLSFFDYIILTLLGIGTIAITITNFIQFLIAVLFLIVCNKQLKNRFLIAFAVVTSSIAFSVFFAEIQNVIWPSAPNFFSKSLMDLISNNSEEKLYISSIINLKSVLNIFNANFSYSYNINNLVFPNGGYLTFQNTLFSDVFSILSGILFMAANLFFMIKTKFKISKHKLYYALLVSYLLNFVLHLLYGNSLSFIYICHYNFIIILIFAYLFNYFKFDLHKYKNLTYASLLLVIGLSLKNIFQMFMILFPLYNHVDYFRVIPAFIIGLVLLFLIIIIIKNKYIRLILIVATLGIICLLWNNINNVKTCEELCTHFDKDSYSLEVYTKQLRDMKNSLNVIYYSDRDTPIDIYYFGMANRPKLLYKEGQLLDIKTKEILKSINYVREQIIPNEYTVLLEDSDGNYYKIYENESGIYFLKNDEKEVIFQSDQKISLPEFENNKYSEILKVLHQEVLFNIDGDIPKPNIITYKGAWYRDTMLAAKVLEETNNTKILEKWVSSINSIYDYQRESTLKEVDNLGELLYIIGATGVKRTDLIDKIKEEINNIKKPDGSISGIVDGITQSYYPTVLALYGAQKVGLGIDLNIPQIDDGYAKLTWYYDGHQQFKTNVDSKYYPYLNWASYHSNGYGRLYMLDEIYPLSYEGGFEVGSGKIEEECFISQYYCEQKISISHLWHASEMFLLLKNY